LIELIESYHVTVHLSVGIRERLVVNNFS